MADNRQRIERERRHAQRILEFDEAHWGWSSDAGRIRRARRADFLAADPSTELAVLEIGCGSGTFTADLARAFPRLVAIDVADTLLEVARSRSPTIDFRVMDAHRMSFANETFDLVVGCSVLHHLDWSEALREVHRVLKPGGRVRFSEPNLWNPQIFVQKNWPWLKRRLGDSPDEYAFTARRITSDLESAGFDDVRAEPYEFLHPSVPPRAIGAVLRLESWLEKTPLSAIAGSLRITARKPHQG
jgi:ubiquinone/menaquinone biosynthesis C-methylase UbiE